MQTNRKTRMTAKTHEGAPAAHMTPMQALRRSVMSAMLFEKEFYEDGEEIAVRVQRLAAEIPPQELADLAVEVAEVAKLRHMPLLLLSVLARTGAGQPSLVADTIAKVIRRPDQMGEMLAIHAQVNGVKPDALKKVMSSQMRKGLAQVFPRFDAYQLAKYDRDVAVKLRDVMFLSHPKPQDDAQKAVWEKLINGTLEAPDTWEVALTRGADKKETFTRLITEGKLGYLALLRNLRGMTEAGVDTDLITGALLARKGAQNVLPFRFVAAARACPQLEPVIDEALAEQLQDLPRLSGKTIVLVDVSGSMDVRLSARSDLTRVDAAATLASVILGDLRVFSFSDRVVEVPPRRGMAGVDAIIRSQLHSVTRMAEAVREVSKHPHDRLIVITDEQSGSVNRVPDPKAGVKGYMINVASNRNGVGYRDWTHIDGFSENVIRFIHEHEASQER